MATLTAYEKRHKVTVIGSGNWGSAIAKIVAENTAQHSDLFEPEVQMWVYEEIVSLPKHSRHFDPSSELCAKPQKLSDIINHFHENVKYLPDITLPSNVIANPSIVSAVKDSTILVFNLPDQFIEKACNDIQGHILPFARAVSCAKGVVVSADSVKLFSDLIGDKLGIYCGALSGANIANEVAREKFSETTIGYDPPGKDSRSPTPSTSHQDLPSLANLSMGSNPNVGKPPKKKHTLVSMPKVYPPLEHGTLKSLFHRPYFHVRLVSDVAAVSLSGALKNIIALGAGFVVGLGWGDNAKAAIMRVGLMEMVQFGETFFADKGIRKETFTEESCGVADLITSCSSGRNFRCAKMAVERGVSVQEIEKTELNGQMLQGISTAKEVNAFLKQQGKEEDFPLMTAVYNILMGKADPRDIPSFIEKSLQ